MSEPPAARRTGVLLAGFGLALAGALAGLLGYVAAIGAAALLLLPLGFLRL